MKDLTTRRIVLGMLMTLVMVFGVLGSADAISRLTRNSGDLQTVTQGNDYQIRFTVGLQGASRIPGFKPVPSRDTAGTDVPATDRTNMYYDDTDNSGFLTGTDTPVDYAAAHYYDQESIAITVSGGSLKKVGSHDASGTSLTMYESTHDSYSTTSNPHQRLSGSVLLTLTAPNPAAVVTITIDPTTDGPTGHVEPPDLIFTVYVVGPLNDDGGTEVLAATNGIQRVSDEADTQIDGHFTFAPAANEPVYYTVEGSGRLYVSLASDRKTPSTNNLYTSSSAPVYLDTTGGSSKVTAYIAGSGDTATVLYIFSGGRQSELPQIEIQSGDGQTGAPSGRLDDYFEVRVTDGRRRPVSGVPVTFAGTDPGSPTTGSMFIPVPGTGVYAAALNQESIDAEVPAITVATATNPGAAATHSVQTDRNGVAKIYYQLSSETGAHTVTATVHGIGINATLTATASSTARARLANLEIVSGNNQRGEKGKYLKDDLVVIVRSLAGHRVQNAIIQFRTTAGTLVPAVGTTQPATVFNQPLETDDTPSPLHPRSGQQIYVLTGPNGEAGVSYNVGQVVEARDVIAEIREEAQTSTQYDFAIDRVVFNVNGSGARAPAPAPAPAPATNTITVVPSSIEGEPGEEVEFTVIPSPTAVVVLDSGDLDDADFSPLFGSGTFTVDLTLPDEAGTYTFTAEAPGYTTAEVTVTVEAEALGTLSITPIGAPSNGSQTFTIGVLDADGARLATPLAVTLTGPGALSQTVNTAGGFGNVDVTLPTAAALYTYTVSAPGYEDGTTQVRVAGTGQPTTPTTPTTPTPPVVGEPDSVSIVGPSTREGTANTELDAALIVQVVDEDGDAVEDARVIFRVRTGQGRLSDRGSGRAIAVQTDSQGYGRATYTPMSASSTVEAEARGVTRTVTFTITASGGTTPPTPRDPDAAPGTISAVVHVGAAQRPPMLWIDGGKIYALVGADVQAFGSGVEGAMNVAIGGGKVYWTERTGESSGTINSANLNGTDVKELKSILAVPMGIAVDVTNSKLYWTNSRGRIQSLNADGSGRVENVIPGGLEGVMDLALAGGNAYWTQGGNVRFVSLKGQKMVRNISTGMDTAGSLAIGGGKVYWTERVEGGGGTVNSANLNGTGETELASILAAPMGIAVDNARSKLYWTNSRGRIQSADLNGKKIQNVVDGLGNPGDMVLNNSIKAPAATTTTTPTTTPTTTDANYDVDGSGSVDNVDVFLVALAVGTSNAKYDVNGDGTVNDKDIALVRDNRDAGAAAAPMVVGMKLSADQIGRLQAQIDLLVVSNDRSPATLKTLVYLQQLIATARPEKTQLLANYPNPFNPETWIPYELATDTTVKITIYNTQGVVVRTLGLGHQSAGYYTGRDRAAYWDGRNAFGEQVASGIYFYQLETDDMSALRKMVILK